MRTHPALSHCKDIEKQRVKGSSVCKKGQRDKEAASKVRTEIRNALGTAQITRLDFASFLKRGCTGDHEGRSPGVNLNKNTGRGELKSFMKIARIGSSQF